MPADLTLVPGPPDISRFDRLRLALASWADRLAGFLRPGASLEDIGPGMAEETCRRVRIAILSAMGAEEGWHVRERQRQRMSDDPLMDWIRADLARRAERLREISRSLEGG
jgi:hypothetical protein